MLQGNYIGTDYTGTTDLGNGTGVFVSSDASNNLIGGANAGEKNIISGNLVGVGMNGFGNRVEGNLIGTDLTGSAALGNDDYGVFIFATGHDNVIGGTVAGTGNVIAHSGSAGTLIGDYPTSSPAFNGNSVLGNSIFNNGGLGIDLGPSGSVTPNDVDDADTGPNDLLNFPVLASAILNGSNLTVSGSINTEQNKTLRIEFFANPTADPTGYGEGQTFLGFVDVAMGASNTATFTQTLATTGVLPGQVITATATDELGNTSEFSLALTVR